MKSFGGVQSQLFPNARLVTTRISSDMGHPNVNPIESESLVEREHAPDFASVYVAINPSGMGLFPDLFNDLRISDITSMPYLVGLGTVRENLVVDVSMRVRQEKNLMGQTLLFNWLSLRDTKLRVFEILHGTWLQRWRLSRVAVTTW